MDEAKAILLNEVRYAERLTQRTARLYRRLAWACTFIGVIAGSSALTALSSRVPAWVSVGGAITLAIIGAVVLTVRPIEKAVNNESEVKKYSALRTASGPMTAEELSLALNKARETDTAEIEPLRDVAYNDVVREIGREDLQVKLHPQQQLLGALA